MVISQLVPFAKSMKIPGEALQTLTIFVGAVGNASGRILSGWMSDAIGRLNVLRLMIGISMVAMPILYLVGGNVALLYVVVFVVYWCYGTQLSVNGAAASDFWGTKNAGINYGMLFTAWGVPVTSVPRSAVRCTSPQLPDGVLHGGSSGGRCPALRTGCPAPGGPGSGAGRQKGIGGSLASRELQIGTGLFHHMGPERSTRARSVIPVDTGEELLGLQHKFKNPRSD